MKGWLAGDKKNKSKGKAQNATGKAKALLSVISSTRWDLAQGRPCANFGVAKTSIYYEV
jgi:hypothetical protein